MEFRRRINSIFNHIYVLNLEKSADRREHINREFNRVGIEKYEFFKATPHDSIEVKELIKNGLVKQFPTCFRCNKKRCDCENNYLTPFQLGNWCSFLNIFRDIIKNDYEFVLICEDDIVFSFQYERIINKLLSEDSFRRYNINMSKPLLIRLGTAYNPDNHNSSAPAVFLKNYSLCNPCFAINKAMAIIYLYSLKIIDYHSDVYFHQKIPKNIKGIQYFTMYPYPVYELSFVKSLQKFSSEVRPHNALRRKEYKEFLFLTTTPLLNIFFKNFLNIMQTKLPYNIGIDIMGYNGIFNNDLLLDIQNNTYDQKYYFEYIIIIHDSDEEIKETYKKISETHKTIIINIYKKDNIEILKNILQFKKTQSHKLGKIIDNIIGKHYNFKTLHSEQIDTLDNGILKNHNLDLNQLNN
jgi:GR25 family glycosyltransferase involved in LPS biosynthesis